MQNINVNIVPDNFPQTIRYSQGDIGRQFKINVADFDIPVGATVKIQATKPSGLGFSVAGVVSDNSVTFTTTEEMTDEAGRFQAELQITAGGDVIGTANFLMIGERNPHPEGTTDGSQGTIIPELTLLVERVEKAASDILDMEVVATTLPAGSQATYSYDEDLNKATFGIPEGQAGAGAAGVVASAYSAAKTYKVGDYVLYNSNLYRCTTAITTAEAWTAAHWTQVVLADDVTDLKSDLDEVTEGIPFAKITDDLSVVNNGVTFAKESDNSFKYYGTATANRNQLFLNGQDDIMISSSPFQKTLEAGTYRIEAVASGYKTTGWSVVYTYTTFASASYLVRPVQLSTIVTFNSPVMIGFQFSNGTDYGTSETPSYITLNITKLSAIDLVSRDDISDNTSDITKIKSALPAISIERGLWTKINDNTDYNDIVTPGTYICLNYSSSLTMTNCPALIGHKMFVIATSNPDRFYQVILPNELTAGIYKRVYNGTKWGAWKKEVLENANYKVLVIGDSYSEQARWLTRLQEYMHIDSLVNLGVTSASVKDKYTDRITYPYTSRPTKNDNTGNHNTFMCQIEKLKRLMTGTDLDDGEEQIYTTEEEYPNVIIIEGGQNDTADSSEIEETYYQQFMKEVSDVYVAYNSEYTPELGSTYIKLPSEECDRTCFAGAYRSIVEELQTLFPKAQIFATSRSLLGYWTAERFPTVTNIRLQQELACNMVGINFINWQGGAQINLMNNYPKGSGTQNDPYCYAQVNGTLATHDTYDLLHPWTLGAKKYAKVVANAIRTQFLDMENM